MGTEPDDGLMESLLALITEGTGVRSLGWSDEEIELSIRQKDGKKWIFAINFGIENGSYQVPEGYQLVLGENKGTARYPNGIL